MAPVFLAVLKKFGPKNENFLSFPIEGYTVALDFKMNQSTLTFLNRLNDKVTDIGGRVYLTKDAILGEKSFKRSYPKMASI